MKSVNVLISLSLILISGCQKSNESTSTNQSDTSINTHAGPTRTEQSNPVANNTPKQIPKGNTPPSYEETLLKRSLGTTSDLIQEELQNRIGRKTTFKKTIDTMSGEWRLICGLPLEVSGNHLDYDSTPYKNRVKNGYFEDGFCALFKSYNKKYRIIEFDLGSSDSPVLEWSITYKLPTELLE